MHLLISLFDFKIYPMTKLEQQDYSERLTNVLPDGIITMQPDGRVLHINLEAQKMLNVNASSSDKYQSNDLFLTDLFGLYHGEEDILPRVFKELTSGQPEVDLAGDNFIRTKIGDILFPVKGKFFLLQVNGDRPEVMFYFRNITGELTQEYVLNTALRRTKIYPWFLDIDRGVFALDSQYFEYLGIEPGPGNTLTMEEYNSRVHPDDRQALVDAFAVQFSGNVVYEKPVPFRLLRGDGTWEWFEGQSTYIGKLSGLPYRLVGICMSIQEHKNIEESLIAARIKAEESDRLKSAFLANMSHEIRTPLNAIVGFSEVLTTALEDISEDDRRDYVDLIKKNSDQLLVLINDILDLSKIESNTMEFLFSSNSLNDIFRDLYMMHLGRVANGVRLELQIPEEDVRINTDSVRLKQVLNNLINNAIKFTTEGVIRIGFRVLSDDEVELFVEDTGEGISEKHLNHIFERFYKVDSFKQGTGLGLAICDTIIASFRGKIGVTSELGKGTCVTVRLPSDNQELPCQAPC